MADPKGPETGKDAQGASSARPRSPTLDLSATDVTPKPKSDPKTDAKPEPGPAAKPAAEAPGASKAATTAASGPDATKPTPAASTPPMAQQSPAAKPDAAKTDAAKAEAPKPESAKPEASRPDASKPDASRPEAAKTAGSSSEAPPRSDAAAARAAARAATPSQSQPQPAARQGVGVLGMALAAIVGAALALGGVALYGKELIGVPQPDLSRVQALEAKLSAVGGDIAALRADLGKLAPADIAPIEARIGDLSKASEATAGRVATLDDSLKALSEQVAKPPAQDPAIAVLTGRIDGLELRFQNAPSPEQLAILLGRVDGVEARFKELPTKEQLAELNGRIDAVGQKIGAATGPISTRVEQIATALNERPKGDPDARTVVALGALDQALADGRPFAPELAVVKAASGETAELAPLDAFAAKGLPTREALGADLAARIAALAPVKPAAEGTILDRLVASAGGVVKITPQGGAQGSDPAAVRSRVAALGAAGDIEGALAARGALDEAARAATEEWAALASARVSAEKAISSARAAALARLTSND